LPVRGATRWLRPQSTSCSTGEVDADLELSDLDHLTLARATPVVERGLDRDGGVHAHHRVDETPP